MTLFAIRDELLAESINAWYEDMLLQVATSCPAAGASHPEDAARSVLHLMRGYERERLTDPKQNEVKLRVRLEKLLSAYLP